MVQLISLISILMIFYWVSMLNFLFSTKLTNITEEASFGIPGARTEPENDLRVKTIVEIDIGFMLEIKRYFCD